MYKRQQVSRTKADGQRVVMGEIRPGGLFAESFACARAESLPVTVTAAADAAVPVSYTHLDVYKRQAYSFAMCDKIHCVL